MSKNKSANLSRRNVIKGGVLIGTALAIGIMPMKTLQANEVLKEDVLAKTRKQVGFSFDEGKCIKCEACVQICHVNHKWEKASPWRKLYKNAEGDTLSMSCNHCADPACAKVCPVGAYTKRESDGIVLHNSAKCVGCGYCSYACPYHSPQLQKKLGAVTKCHFCSELQDEGKLPLCVGACPTQALTIGDMNELSQKGNLDYKGLPNPKITNPSMIAISKE